LIINAHQKFIIITLKKPIREILPRIIITGTSHDAGAGVSPVLAIIVATINQIIQTIMNIQGRTVRLNAFLLDHVAFLMI
jgi:hypothetical protein